jgi:hypothetical protein
MKKMAIPMVVLVVMMLASCARDKQTVPAASLSPAPGVPVVEIEGYTPFRILMRGDSFCGTISSNLQIQFDCGELAGTYAHERHGKRDGRCVVARTKDRVAATIVSPPAEQESEYYPINVFSQNQDVKEGEVKRLARVSRVMPDIG